MWHFFSFVMFFFFFILFSIFLLFVGFFRDCIHIFSSCQLAETLFIDRCEICVHSSKLFQQAFFLENCEVKLAICIESNKSSIHCLLNVMMLVFFCCCCWRCYVLSDGFCACAPFGSQMKLKWIIHCCRKLQENQVDKTKLHQRKP